MLPSFAPPSNTIMTIVCRATLLKVVSGIVRNSAVFALLSALLYFAAHSMCAAAADASASISGTVTDPQGAVVAGASVVLLPASGSARQTQTDLQGNFTFASVASGEYRLAAHASGFSSVSKPVSVVSGKSYQVSLQFTALAGQRSTVIVSSTLEPSIDRRNSEVFSKTLFERDDQLLETLDAGINAGQHEGGGKSLEIRRFGFNLDHGGVNGGLKVVVNDLPQNQASQGHGQGYLGALKALTPELVQEVSILNGPFSPEYGDFSGLGVVQIRTRESLPDQVTLRAQGGAFDSYRTFLAYSPDIQHVDSFLAYEGSYTNGPFVSPLRYARDNFTGNYTRHWGDDQALGIKINFGTNYFYSSGQIPLDLVAEGKLDRFGYVDPTDGGRVRLGTTAAYYRKQIGTADSFKMDAYLGRSLFDLYSNFTFFLNDHEHGDGIQQHDSRYQEGVNSQFLHFHHLAGARALLTVGTNFHAEEINVGLYPREGRVPLDVETRSFLVIPNFAGYAQEGLDLLNSRLHFEGGLRWDYFHWSDSDRVNRQISSAKHAARLQPKGAIAYKPLRPVPLTLSFNYGRGINTQDARGIIEQPESPRIATTDFYSAGTAFNYRRFSFTGDLFLIDRSNEEVYIPDDGTFEFKGASRSYGYEGKASVQLTRRLSLNGGLTQVTNSFYRGLRPRIYVDSAPHTVGNAGLTLSGVHGFFGSLRYRHISNYRLDGLDPTIRASGLDVLDFALTKQVRRWLDFNLGIDNLTNKVYYETQNYFESRVTPDAPALCRIHGTPGYPFDLTVGATFHLWSKQR
jgi:TonB dependent receptor-like, beta-barrel/Carboxypeptidase regulatory-like domain/TonB-dependent Receptor Plug Domain